MVTVSAGARLHFGFQNLSLAHDRLYGGVGAGLAAPRVRVRAEPASDVVVRATDSAPTASPPHESGATEEPTADARTDPGATDEPTADAMTGPGTTDESTADARTGPGATDESTADAMTGPGTTDESTADARTGPGASEEPTADARTGPCASEEPTADEGTAPGARSLDLDTDVAAARRYAQRAVDVLDVPGARVTVEAALPRHVGLGSGTQLALATYAAVAHANDVEPRPRRHAPALGRGGRSGVGVATFEDGGFVVDAGHPTTRFTTEAPARGEWETPAVMARHDLPEEWRFVLAIPHVDAGRNGEDETESMRDVIEAADPGIADAVAGVLTRRVLPAAATNDRSRFAAGIGAFGRRNGAWYADVQGGVFRPPVGEIVAALGDSPVVDGVGQSSWGPTVYGVTHVDDESAAVDAGEQALAAAGVDGDVFAVAPANAGASVTRE